MKELEQRLFEAFKAQRGLKLTSKDVDALIFDDAVGCRITNQASTEAGLGEWGADEIQYSSRKESWTEFKKRLQLMQTADVPAEREEETDEKVKP